MTRPSPPRPATDASATTGRTWPGAAATACARSTTAASSSSVPRRYGSRGSSLQRSTATTLQPAAASVSTVAAPMPRAAPVTTATRVTPSSRGSGRAPRRQQRPERALAHAAIPGPVRAATSSSKSQRHSAHRRRRRDRRWLTSTAGVLARRTAGVANDRDGKPPPDAWPADGGGQQGQRRRPRAPARRARGPRRWRAAPWPRPRRPRRRLPAGRPAQRPRRRRTTATAAAAAARRWPVSAAPTAPPAAGSPTSAGSASGWRRASIADERA